MPKFLVQAVRTLKTHQSSGFVEVEAKDEVAALDIACEFDDGAFGKWDNDSSSVENWDVQILLPDRHAAAYEQGCVVPQPQAAE